MKVTLRPYQLAARDECYRAWRESPESPHQPMVVIATGGGKTITGLSMVADCIEAGKRVLWLAHREELLNQPLAAFRGIWGEHADKAGIVQAGRDDSDKAFVIASIDTLRNDARLKSVLEHGMPRLVVCDEAHHTMAQTWIDVLEAMPGALRLGLTATPERSDSKDLGKLWDIRFVYSMVRAIHDGYLVEPRHVLERLPKLNLNEVGGRDDYDDKELGDALLMAGVVEHSVKVMQKHCVGRHVLLFTATVEQAQKTSSALCEAGFRSRFVSGKTSKTERAQVVEGFEKGLIDVVVNCAVLTEGTDLPICDTVILARPTRSKSLYIQCIGRGLRLYPNKEHALIIDIAGASEEHSLIQAPILLGEMEEDEKKGCPESPVGQHDWKRTEAWVSKCALCDRTMVHDPLKKKKSALNGLTARRERVKAIWEPLQGLDRRGFVCDCGEHGMIYVLENIDGSGTWLPWLAEHRRRKPTPLSDIPVGLELAYGLGDDVVRRAAALTAPKAMWRNGKMTNGQATYMARLGIHLHEQVRANMTRGQAARLITQRKAATRAVKLGIARRGR